MSRDHASAEELFRCLDAEHVDPILGFAMRRADRADDAADIVAETSWWPGDGSTRCRARVDRVQDDEPEVGDGRVRDERHDVGLPDGQHRAVDEADHREGRDPRREPGRGVGDQGEAVAQGVDVAP
jgi:hypothetical protein